jgi:hypothetical protein
MKHAGLHEPLGLFEQCLSVQVHPQFRRVLNDYH